jgi:hypothetical protein
VHLRWAERPEKAAYKRAREQLALVMPRAGAMELAGLLRDEAAILTVAPGQILLAARVAALPVSDPGVRRVLASVRRGRGLEPVLLVRPAAPGGALLIADGYERVSAAYHRARAPVPCRIVSIERGLRC